MVEAEKYYIGHGCSLVLKLEATPHAIIKLRDQFYCPCHSRCHLSFLINLAKSQVNKGRKDVDILTRGCFLKNRINKHWKNLHQFIHGFTTNP